MIHRFIISIFLLLLTYIVCGQEIKSYIQENAVSIASIDPSSDEYSDLTALKNAIGDARVVMLGEQTHGDATAFEAKTRMVKMLHEEMGFDVLVWESDFYGLHHSWKQVNEIGVEGVNKNIFPNWSICSQLKPLFAYTQESLKTNNPLIFSGCDSRHHGRYTKDNYMVDFQGVFEQTPFYKKEKERFVPILEEVLQNEYFSKASQEDQQYFLNGVDELAKNLGNMQLEEKDFWLQELDNLKTYAFFAWKNHPSINYISGERDVQMAENLNWLAKVKYPNEKLIFWAYNLHIVNNPSLIPTNVETAGDEFKKIFDEPSYIVGFDSYKGYYALTHNPEKKHKIDLPKKKSFERWIDDKGYRYAFVDFVPSRNIKEEFHLKGSMDYTKKVLWNHIFDGVFYIKEMEGCRVDEEK